KRTKLAKIMARTERDSGLAFKKLEFGFLRKLEVSHAKHSSSNKYKNVFLAATSVPCFEYWLLLHYNFTTKPFEAKGKLSIADTVIKELKQVYPKYKKRSNNVFSDLLPRIEDAKKNAEKVLKQSLTNNTDNPSTRVHELVDYLQNLRNQT
ncbi:MAG: RloB family protein, partial [Pseudomonadota bacterium]|nr:RloB family protein [Pseudomonadota bacterium]